MTAMTKASLTKPSALSQPPTLKAILTSRRAALLGAILLSMAASAFALAPFVAVYLVAAELFTHSSVDTTRVLWIAGGAAVALVLRAVCGGAATTLAHASAYATLADLRRELVEKLGRMPLGQVQARSSGALKKIIHDDVEQMEEALAHGVPDIAAAAAVPLVTTALLITVDWQLGLVALAALILLVLVGGTASALAKGHAKRETAAMTELSIAVTSYLRGLKVLRAFTRPDMGFDQAGTAVERMREAVSAVRFMPARWFIATLYAGTGLAVALLLPVAGHGFVTGSTDIATLALFLLLGLGYLGTLLALLGTMATVAYRIQLAAGHISALLAEPELSLASASAEPAGHGIALRAVEFSYSGAPVLRGVDLDIAAGTRLALVGATGAGKSTVARLIARFWDADSGSVRIGGADVSDIAPARLAQLVSFVQQDEYIFNDTLLENIRIGRPDATDEQVRAAARAAQLDEVAGLLPDGWDTPLGAAGELLSGGERQRVSIARALLKNAPIVIFDEATASLDGANQQAVLAAIDSIDRSHTVITIAHRLSTVTTADTIVILDKGAVAARGSHDELIASSALYRELWEAYSDADGWRITLGAGTKPVTVPATPREPVPVSKAERIIRPGVGAMTFGAQWRTLLGNSWTQLKRQGFIRLFIESALRSAPLVAVFLMLDAAIRQVNGGQQVTTGLVWGLTAFVAVMIGLRVLAAERANNVVWDVSGWAKADVQLSLIQRLRRVPLGFTTRVDNARASVVISTDAAALDFQNVPQQLAGTFVQPVVAAAILTIIDWRLALAALAGIPVFLLLTVWTDRIYHRVFAPVHDARGAATATLLEQVRGAAVLRAYPQSSQARRYLDAVEQLRAASVGLAVRAVPATALSTIAVELGSVAVIITAALLYGAGSVSATTVLLFLVLSLALYQPIQELNQLAGYRRNQQQIARKIGEIWDEQILPEPQRPATPADASIELRNVSFAYDAPSGELLEGGHESTLTDVSFTAHPGTVTALIGHSGAGKTTVANLISRFWDVNSGAVLIGGEDVRELGSAMVMDCVATVFQDVYLFPDTFRANLTLGRPAAADAEIKQALDAAQCDFITAAGGLDAMVTEGGTSLSGGQRQRLSIARALLKDSPILILDEAVASVDPYPEVQIQQALAKLMEGRTVIVIAHRLSTVAAADQIIVLDHGRVAATGRHDDLLASSEAYRAMWRAQESPLPA